MGVNEIEGSLFKANEFHVEDEGGVGRDDAGVTLLAVREVRSARQLRALAYGHLRAKQSELKLFNTNKTLNE